MNAKENYLQAIYYGSPDYVPLSCEPIAFGFSFDGIVKMTSWTDRWGVDWKLELAGMVPFPKGNPLADLARLNDYVFPDPEGLILAEKTKYELDHVDRVEKLIIGNMSYLLFERAWALMGLERFLVALIEQPCEVHELLHRVAIYAKKVFDRYLALGVDGIGFSEDLGSQRALMISPSLFREFLLPEYGFIFENVIKEKKIINFHSCGCVDAIAGDLASIGITVLNPVQARANDLNRLKALVSSKMALNGGIDTHLLMTGTREQVCTETRRVLDILKPGGGYICGPDQYLPNMPQENLDAMWSTARSYGRY